MLTHLSIGPLTVSSYPFLALLGFWAGLWLAAKEAQRLGIDGDHVYNIGLYSLIGGLLGGRGWYVLTHWESYAGEPLQALALTANAIAIPEAMLIALVITIVYIKRHSLVLATVADALAPGFALALAVGGVGAFLGSQQLGTITSLPWGIEQFEQIRHPSHLYQTVANVLMLAVIWKIRKTPRWPGFIVLLFVELYAGSRLLLDPFFAMPQTIGAGFRLVQIVALTVMIVTLAVMARMEHETTTKTNLTNPTHH